MKAISICEYGGTGTLELEEVPRFSITNIGTVLPLEPAGTGHEMLGGEPHKRGKIVLSIAA